MSTGNVDHCSTGVKGHGRLGEIKGVASLTPQHLCLATLGDSPGTSAGKALRQTQPDGGGAWACQAPRGHRGRDACLEESTPRPRLHPEAQLQCGLRSSESLRLNPHYIRFYRARIFPSLTGTYRNKTQCPPSRNQSEKKSHTFKWTFRSRQTVLPKGETHCGWAGSPQHGPNACPSRHIPSNDCLRGASTTRAVKMRAPAPAAS